MAEGIFAERLSTKGRLAEQSQDSGANAPFLLDAMAAPASALRVSGLASTPRKWVSGGLRLVAYASESAPTLPFDAGAQSISWESMRLPRQCHSRSRRPCSLLRAAARFENLGSSDSAVIDSRYKAAQDRLAEILTAACEAREELLSGSAIHRPASRRRGRVHQDSLQELVQ